MTGISSGFKHFGRGPEAILKDTHPRPQGACNINRQEEAIVAESGFYI